MDQALAVPVSLAENNGGLSLCDARAGATPRAAWVTMYARRQRLFIGVRRDKGGAFQWVQIPPGNRSSRKQSEQSWR